MVGLLARVQPLLAFPIEISGIEHRHPHSGGTAPGLHGIPY